MEHKRRIVYRHYQCRFKDQTKHKHPNIDIAGVFCEYGLNCVDNCPFSYTPEDENFAIEAFEKKSLCEISYRRR